MGAGPRAWLRPAALALAAGLAAGPAAAPGRPLVSVLLTCSALAPNLYPADTQNWFDGSRQRQVILYSYLLFPVRPRRDEAAAREPWHPPMAVTALGGTPDPGAGHYAEARWRDPAGRLIADYGETLTARPKDQWLEISGRSYQPHTFAMAIGVRDLRAAAGQTALPSAVGRYTVRLLVDGRSVGLTFFSMIRAAPQGTGGPLSPSGSRSYKVTAPPATPTPVPIPTLPSLDLPS